MLISIFKVLKSLSPRSKTILAIAGAIAIASMPFAVAAVLINSGSISYKSGDREIKYSGKVKKQINDTEYSNKAFNKKLIDLEKEIENLTPASIGRVKKTFSEFEPTAHHAIEESEKMVEVAESAIAEE